MKFEFLALFVFAWVVCGRIKRLSCTACFGGGTLRPDRLMACNVLYRPLGFMSTLVSMGYKLCFHISVEIHEEGTLTVTYELLYIVNLR